jgi:hypothetical protein
MAHDDALAHASADDEYQQTPAGSTYEHSDANVWIIFKFLIWLGVSAVVIHLGLGVLYGLLIRQSMVIEQPYPLAAGQEERLPPAPRLQQFPRNELYQFRLDEESVLQRYGWMNKEAGIVHIPVDVAMRLVRERGLLQSKPPEADQSVATPGLIPADSSAGRTMELRRQ